MGRRELLDYLLLDSDVYEYAENLTMTGGSPDTQAVYSPICERPIMSTGYDVFGVHFTNTKPASHRTPGQEPLLRDICNWREEIRFPIVDRFDWEYVRAQGDAADRENKVIITTMAIGPFERTSLLGSFDDVLVAAIEEPEAYKALIDRIADYKIEVIHHLYEYGHPDLINLHDDWGTAKNTFFSPNMWRDLIKPATQRMYDAVQECGMIVGQHSCGNIGALVKDMIEMGCQVWEAQEDANDIPALQAEYGEQLRILAPPPPKESYVDEIKTSVSSQSKGGMANRDEKLGLEPPLPADTPKCFIHYDRKPTHLWE